MCGVLQLYRTWKENMKTPKGLAVGIFLAGLLLMLQVPPAVLAQDPDPSSRVARLNYSSGSVSFQPGGEGDWVQAVSNRPLTTGDNLWSDKDSRAELHVGSTAIRMDSETSLTFLELDDHVVQLRLSAGSVIVRVKHIDDGDTYEIDTPNLAFDLQRSGVYRVDVNADGNETVTTVWSGRGEATGGGDSYTVIAGQRARFSGTDQLDHEIDQLPGRDDFDQWALGRDQREDRAESANYISAEMTGYEDLDDYGRWQYVADYGPVWYPTQVAAEWAPYRYGHWVWIAPWGWTWVEDEPWGFAPFHYGRWAFVERRWCWVPGPVVVRPVYAPALVAFVGGGGSHFSIAIGGGPGVAWFPLAPGEVYVPPYRVSHAYVNNVNITNTRVNVTQVTNVYNIYNNTTNVTRVTYANQRVPSGVTAVSRETFVNARPVSRNLAQVDARQMAEARVTRNLEVQPAKASVLGAGQPVAMRPPARVMERSVIARHNPPPPRVPLEQRPATRNARIESPQPAPQPEVRGKETSRAPQPSPAARPDERPIPRAPGSARTQEAPPASRPQESARPEQRSRPRSSPAAEGARPESNRPLVRPAPPVQNKPEHQQTEERKFRTWQEQRPKTEAPPHPPEKHPPAEHAPQPQKPDKQ